MTTLSRHSYTAENDLGTPLSNPGGSITLDAGSIPHVTARVTFPVEDPALLDELDPRDSRRIVIGATRAGHTESIYSAWAEQRREYNLNPRMANNTAGWTVTSGIGLTQTPTPAGTRLDFASAVSGTPALFYQTTGTTTATTVLAGRPWSSAMRLEVPAGYPALTLRLRTYAYGSEVQLGTATVTIPSGSAVVLPVDCSLVAPSGTSIVRSILHSAATIPAGARLIVSEAQLEAVTEISGFFDGSTASGDLTRHRWLGAVNNSISVLETRIIAGLKWIPEGFRFFDLGIRSCSPDRAAGTVTLDLASDEAILSDFAQLADDETPRTLETSLRDVVDYVLDKIDAALEPGTEDADLTAYWRVALLNSNPAGQLNTNGYWAGAGASALTSVAVASPAPAIGTRAVRWTAAAGASSVGVAGWDGISTTKEGRVTPGRRYGTVVRMLSNPGRSTTITLGFRDENGRHFSNVVSPAQVTSIGAFTEFYLNAVAPAGAAYAYVSVTTVGNSAGQNHWVQAILYEGRWRIPMFYGDSIGGGYTYAWAGDPNASPSERIPITERDPESLVWPAGVSAMDFLHPILLTTGLRLVCDEQRRWALRSEGYRSAGSQTWRAGVNVMDPNEKLSRDDESWFDAAVYIYTWTDAAGIEHTRADAYSLTGTPTKALRVELRDTPYPGPGRAQHVVQRAQGKGREVTVTGIASWLEQTDQALTVTLDGTPLQTGISARVRFDLDTDTVTVTSRTTDTPANAIVLLPGTINALPGTINDL